MSTATIEAAILGFVQKIKDDPGLSDLFRAAATELHDLLDPPKKNGKTGGADKTTDG